MQLFTLSSLLYLLITTHITIALVTIYLHRAMAHRSLTCSPWFDKTARIWLWFFTGQVTTEWVSVHRKHHAKCETEQDPHSPVKKGVLNVLFLGVYHYKKEAANPATISRYSHGCPKDKLEQFFFKYSWLGLVILLGINLMLFPVVPAIVCYVLQLIWIPFWAAGVINSLAHTFGYRNSDTPDASANISPWGIIIGGEELHNNHHAYPTSAKLSMRAFEFDIGWCYIRALEYIKAVRDVKVSTLPVSSALPAEKSVIAYNTNDNINTSEHSAESIVQSFLKHHSYYKKYLSDSLGSKIKKELQAIKERDDLLQSHSTSKLYKLLQKTESSLTPGQKETVKHIRSLSYIIDCFLKSKAELAKIIENKKLGFKEAVGELSAWAHNLEAHFSTEVSDFIAHSRLKMLNA